MAQEVAIIGMGTMGTNLAVNLARKKVRVHVYNNQKLKRKNITCYTDPNEMLMSMQKNKNKVMISMIPMDDIFDEMKENLKPNDIIIDGANEIYTKSQKRGETFEKFGIRYLGAGIACGSFNSHCVMIGGNTSAYEETSHLFNMMCAPSYHAYFGKDYGIGHFVKMVHDGIEQTMIQMISEVYSFYGPETFLTQLNEWPINGFIKIILSTMNAEKKGLWCVGYASENNISIPIIHSSVDARIMSKSIIHKVKNVKTFKEKKLIEPTLKFAFACALSEGKLICEHYGVDFNLALNAWYKGSKISSEMINALIQINVEGARQLVCDMTYDRYPCMTISNCVQWYDTQKR